MRIAFLSGLAFSLILPLSAFADEGDCQQTCDTYRQCAGEALESIYNGSCTNYTSCGNVVDQCRAAISSTCRPVCEDPQF